MNKCQKKVRIFSLRIFGEIGCSSVRKRIKLIHRSHRQPITKNADGF